ncbi:uncharacterized protein B0H18DRAFT_636579 [Fomitopsis serialis]|uniref:uncharacterized protein n=1 Tax=Fomitopsis serialis TaxID=139415 RepID=UPI002008D16D|nr:uncharacterized protein B0H18DRAFT_636579 [Neoantrodia serialis]KAH9919411.1 hypothetical protein B0H18DRAFT_636579 [Neoantrodia serialis]
MMHRALTIQELVRLVVNEVSRPGPLKRPSLLALALTCRAFHEAALDMLWTRQYGLGSLVQCLPKDLWTLSDDTPKGLTLREPTRPTTRQDWERFDFYARRVRSLHVIHTTLRGRSCCILSENLFRWLLSSRPSHQLIPRLSFLKLGLTDNISSGYYDSAHMLFGPQLTSLQITAREFAGYGVILATLSHLPLRSPDIQEVKAFTKPREGRYRYYHFPIEVFLTLKGLKTLWWNPTSSPVTFDVFARMATLPNLTEVNLSIINNRRATGQSGAGGAAQTLTFRTLERLTMKTTTMNDVNAFLSACRFPRLQEMILDTPFSSTSNTLDSVLRLIHERCPHTILNTIHIQCGEDAGFDEDGVQTLTVASMRRLYDFRGLQDFKLAAKMCIVLDDDAVKEMAMSWPHLEHMQLTSAAHWATPTATTLEGLAHFARYCPSLWSLIIDVQTADTVVSADVRPGGGFCNYVLEDIEFGDSTALGNCAMIGAFLNAIFPNLQQINGDYDDEGYCTVMGESWRRVWNTIEVLRMTSQWDKYANE